MFFLSMLEIRTNEHDSNFIINWLVICFKNRQIQFLKITMYRHSFVIHSIEFISLCITKIIFTILFKEWVLATYMNPFNILIAKYGDCTIGTVRTC